jgi:hypothetical protein
MTSTIEGNIFVGSLLKPLQERIVGSRILRDAKDHTYKTNNTEIWLKVLKHGWFSACLKHRQSGAVCEAVTALLRA